MAKFVPGPNAPSSPSIYHIMHVDRLASVLKDGCLYSDAIMSGRDGSGTVIGFAHTKSNRTVRLLEPGVDLRVGECVPFYYCPRSVMLYVIYKRNHPELTYLGGQEPVVHLRFDPVVVATWAEQNRQRYYVTDVTAAAAYFTAYPDIDALNVLDWKAIESNSWVDVTDRKQAEFLVEKNVPIGLVREIGVCSQHVKTMVDQLLKMNDFFDKCPVNVRHDWYY